MNKTDLLSTYTAEQLAEMVVNASTALEMFGFSDDLKKTGLFKNPLTVSYEAKLSVKQYEIESLQSEVTKYRKAFEDAKKERDQQVCEYQNKIDGMALEIELLSKDSISVYQEPIDIAKDLINAEGEYEHNPIEKAFCGTDKGKYCIFDLSELRQIAEHLLVYCNHHGEVEE